MKLYRRSRVFVVSISPLTRGHATFLLINYPILYPLTHRTSVNIILLFRFIRVDHRSRHLRMKSIFILSRVSRGPLCLNAFLYCQRANSASVELSSLMWVFSYVSFDLG